MDFWGFGLSYVFEAPSQHKDWEVNHEKCLLILEFFRNMTRNARGAKPILLSTWQWKSSELSRIKPTPHISVALISDRRAIIGGPDYRRLA